MRFKPKKLKDKTEWHTVFAILPHSCDNCGSSFWLEPILRKYKYGWDYTTRYYLCKECDLTMPQIDKVRLGR